MKALWTVIAVMRALPKMVRLANRMSIWGCGLSKEQNDAALKDSLFSGDWAEILADKKRYVESHTHRAIQ